MISTLLFFNRSLLNRSLICSLGERPYTCPVDGCDKRFARSDELSRHRRAHSGEKKFACALCGHRFVRSDHLVKHETRHHKRMFKERSRNALAAIAPGLAKGAANAAANGNVNVGIIINGANLTA